MPSSRSAPSRPPTSLPQMHAAWVRFATTGDPGWQPFDASYPVMTFGGPGGPAVVLDPRADERASWPDDAN